MKNHTELLNYLVTTFGLQSYLEIGVQNPANNFFKIKCDDKVGVDPAVKSQSGPAYYISQQTSDEWFTEFLKWVDPKFHLIFIDGLHTKEQVKRDFDNSLRCLADNGFIVIHDTLPEKEAYTHVPRASKIWNGDVYKFACSLINYPNIKFLTLNADHGCTVVYHAKRKAAKAKPVNNWQQFQAQKSILNIVSAEEMKELLTLELNIKQTA